MRRFILVVAALLFALGAGANEPTAKESALPQTDGTVHVGDLAPDFELTTLDGKPLSLHKDFKGKTTILVFWSFFCFPCQTEMPELQAFLDSNGESARVASIALDGPQYDKHLLPYIAEHKLTYPIAYDRETEKFYETAERYGVQGTPTFFILDDAMRIRFIHLGRIEPGLLKGIVDGAKSKSYCAEIVKPPMEAKK